MNRKTLSIAVGVLAAAAAPLMAQGSCTGNTSGGCGVNVSTSVTVPLILQLDLNTAVTTLTAPTAANFGGSGVQDVGPIATVKANAAWKVAVNSTGSFGYTGSASPAPTKNASDLTWGTVAGTYPNAMGTTAATLFSGSTGTSGLSQQIFYQTFYNYATDVPGTYTLNVTFTLSSP